MGMQAPFVGVREYTALDELMEYSHFEVPMNKFNSKPSLLSLSLNAPEERTDDGNKSQSFWLMGTLTDGVKFS